MSDLVELLADPDTQKQYLSLPADYRAAFEWRAKWLSQAHKHQIVPSGDWWDIWLMLAGRGAGKTRTAAEQIGWWAWQQPNTRWLVAAPTSADVRGTCFEGDSGLLNVIPSVLIKDYNKALHELTLTNGSMIKGIPASEPERFRGAQFHGGWCCSPDTLITMADGSYKKIKDIRKNEVVMTRHGARRVLASCVSGNTNKLVRIVSGRTSLTVTTDHPILVGDQWIAAGDIKKGDMLWQTTNQKCAPIELKQVAVKSVELLPNSTTYNLTVEGEHEFIANGVVVHNCDELAAWEYIQDAWDMMMFGMRLGKKVKIICTTTPRPKDLIVELVGREGDDVVLTRASTYANIDNLADNFRKQILQYEGTKLGRQEIEAELIDPEESGIVKREMFRLWPPNKPFPKFEFIIQSYDCAYTEKTVNDPTAATTWGVFKPLDGAMAVMLIDAWQDRLQYPDLRPKVIEEFKVSYGSDPEEEGRGNFTGGKKVDLVLIEDKAAGISLIQDLQRAHLPVRAYNPGRADKIQRLSIVANIIAHKRVWIPESTQRKGYVRDWAEGFVSQICSFPDSTHDDYVDSCVDSSTQVTMSDLSIKRVDEIVVGDYVMTPEGKQLVSAVHSNGIKELWEVTAGNKTLLATEDHKVFTQRGYVRVDSLIQGIDNVYFLTKDTSWDSQAKATSRLKQLYSMVSVTTVTLKARIRRIGSIMLERVTDYTETFGSSTRAQSQPVTTSITLMGTLQTTTSPTLIAYQGRRIGLNTQQHLALEAKLQSISRTLIELDQKQQCGIQAQKGWSGIKNILLNLLQKAGASLSKPLRRVASGVAQIWKPRQQERSSAQQNANQQKQITAVVSQVRNTHTMQPVYDLTVENEHCYYANGILVHNCTQALRYLRDAGFLDIDPTPRDDDDDDYVHTRKKRVNPYAV